MYVAGELKADRHETQTQIDITYHYPPELLELHEQLYHALAPVTVNAYGDEAGEAYHPHLTVYDEPLPELEYRTTDILNTMQLGDGFECSSVFLMGHIGQPYRGRWTAVREFVLGGK